MSYLRLNKKTSRYEVRASIPVLDTEMLRQFSLYKNFCIPRYVNTACIMIVKQNSIQYFFCNVNDWQIHYNCIALKDRQSVIMVCDVTKGFASLIKFRPYYETNDSCLPF